MKVKRPFHLSTETMSAFYETFEEGMNQFNFWKQFYITNAGLYGTHEITLTRNGKQILSTVIVPANIA